MLFVGDDWAEDRHDIEIVDDVGRRLAQRRLPEGSRGVSRLNALIATTMPDQWADLDDPEAEACLS